MKHSKSTKAIALLMSMTMITSVFVGNTLSRYVTSVSSTDNARVAIWGINGEDTTMELFNTSYDLAGKTIAKSNVDGEKIIAPGTGGQSAFSIINYENDEIPPEVAYEVKISLDDSAVDPKIVNNSSIQWKLDDGSWGSFDSLKTSLLSLVGDPSGVKVYAPGTFANAFKGDVEHKIYWQWLLDGNNEVDTQMGNDALTSDIGVKISVSVTAQQIDDLVTNANMLEGANQSVNLQDVQTLSFRSASDINNFERVEVNGQPINEGTDYTKTEGSTIITLTESYIASLTTDRYVIDIISTDMTASTVFEVVDELVLPEASDVLSENSWETISAITKAGKASDYWEVGEKTTVKVNGIDKEVAIAGINHDGENTVTFVFTEMLSEFIVMNQDGMNYTGWTSSEMRTTTMPTILTSMENKDVIIEVEKKTISGYGYGGYDDALSLRTTNDKLFLLSKTEVFGGSFNEGEQYEYFKTRNNRAIQSDTYGELSWWLRTPVEYNDYHFYQVDSYGDEVAVDANSNSNEGVVAAFVIG